MRAHDDPFLRDYVRTLAARADALATACVHAGEHADPHSGALEPPIVLASAFEFDGAAHAAAAFRRENDAWIYGRWGNPTVAALEAKLAALEGAEAACAAASGMAAISGALLSVATDHKRKRGGVAHVVAPRSMYAESARLLRERLPLLGVETTFVDGTDASAWVAAARDETCVFYIETPSNPVLRVTDVAGVVAAARARGIVTIADNTFATPFCATPLALGVDLVVHSMTKALGGHGDAIGGAICGGREIVERAREWLVKGMGGVIAPLTAFLVSRGIRTLHLRQARACETAAILARRLSERPDVAVVHHPSLPTHPEHARAAAQMHAHGSMLSFELAKAHGRASLERGARLLSEVSVLSHAVSLGDVRSLVVHPASTTHSTMPAPDRERAGVADGLVRVSVGIESVDDLERDLLAAMDRA